MKLDYLKHKYILIAISIIIIVVGIAYGLITGYRFDVDFKGGTKIEADLKEEFENHDIENIIKEITGTSPLVQKTTGGSSAVSITCEPMDQETSDKVVEALKEKYQSMDEPSVRNVQPSYGKELLGSAMLAVGVAIVIILLYVGIRFKTLGFTAAVTAIIALVHDVLIVIAAYGIIKFPINSTFIAVLLTIIGYSINDTIIIYDRIRENRKKVSRSLNLLDTINYSISQTITRTIYTSLTTVVAIGIVYVFALTNNQQVLKEFSLPLIIGILVGTYSSIFIATSLWNLLENITKKFKDRKKDKNNKSKNKKK